MFDTTQISFVLSGGSDNRDPSASLGGEPSVQPIIGLIDNLFSDIPTTAIGVGSIDYRCFYIFNDSADTVLYDCNVYVLNQIEGASTVQLGFNVQDDIQSVTFSTAPSEGNVIFIYEKTELLIGYSGDLDQFASDLITGLESLPGVSSVTYVPTGSLSFTITFLGGKFQPLLMVTANTTGAEISVVKVKDGSPVNAVTVQTASGTTTPSGISFSFPEADAPFLIGDLYPGDGFPVWVQRTLLPAAVSSYLDGFTVDLNCSPAATGTYF